MRRRIFASAIVVSMLAGCDGQSNGAESNINELMAVTEEPPRPEPNFDDHEGDTYFYVTAVSEEDQKKGKSAGDVVALRYLGKKGDLYRLELLGDDEQRISVAECANPCKVIKYTTIYGGVDRIGFSENSVIGSAFLDAFNGLLAERGQTKQPNRASEADVPQREERQAETESPSVDEYERLNELCRGGAGDADSTMQACEERDRLYPG